MIFCWLVEAELKDVLRIIRSHLISQDMLFLQFQWPFLKKNVFLSSLDSSLVLEFTCYYDVTFKLLNFFTHECTMTCTVSHLIRHCSVEDSGSAHSLTLITTGCFVLLKYCTALSHRWGVGVKNLTHKYERNQLVSSQRKCRHYLSHSTLKKDQTCRRIDSLNGATSQSLRFSVCLWNLKCRSAMFESTSKNLHYSPVNVGIL